MHGNLSDGDHERLDGFLGEVFAAVKAGSIARGDFIEGMAYVMTALDVGNYKEALFCLGQGLAHFKLDTKDRTVKLASLRSVERPTPSPDDASDRRRRA